MTPALISLCQFVNASPRRASDPATIEDIQAAIALLTGRDSDVARRIVAPGPDDSPPLGHEVYRVVTRLRERIIDMRWYANEHRAGLLRSRAESGVRAWDDVA